MFDFSGKHDGVSVNDVLLSGPDLKNMLKGVFICFYKESLTVAAD